MKNYYREKLIQRYYSARAQDYDRQKSRTWQSTRGFGNKVFQEILQGLKGYNNKSLLEIGVGSGRNAKLLLERINPYLVGLDLSKEMLRAAGSKLVAHREKFDLILGGAEDLPLIDESFDAILCISTMHYFADQEKALSVFKRLLKKNGVLIYGDLTEHESDDEEFFENLERTISKAHSKYYKASEMKGLMEKNGFHVARTTTIEYQKRYDALIEDKGRYFGVGIDSVNNLTQAAASRTRKQYTLTDTGLTQFFTVISANRKA